MTSEKDSYTVSSSQENTNSFSAGVSTSVTATATLSTNLVNNEASLTAEVKADTEMRSTSTFTQSEESQLVTATEAYSLSSTTLGESTKLQMWFTIENVGNDLLTDPLTELMFNLYLGNDQLPFHSESFAETAGALTQFTNIEPGETVELTIKDIPLNLDQAMRFLANEGVRVEAEHYSFGSDQVYFINAQASNLQLVTVSEDGIDSRYVYLPETMNLKQVLETAKIDYQQDETGLFTFIGDMVSQTEELPYKTLSIHHTPENEIGYSPSNVDDMLFGNGDILVIKNQIDTDGDLLPDEDEFPIGTNPKEPDTDGDGLTDGFSSQQKNLVGELSGCTHPLLPDTDFDGTNDGDEIEEGTDPCGEVTINPPGFALYDTNEFSKPVARNADGRLEVFGIGGGSALYHMSQGGDSKDGWSDWSSLGGVVTEIAVGQNADGRLEVFAVGGGSALYHMWQTAPNNGWSGWSNLGGVITDIEVARNADGRLEVFGIGGDNALYHMWQGGDSKDGWSDWSSLGGWVSEIAVGQNADGRLEVFGIGGGNVLYHMSQGGDSKDGWSDWSSLGGIIIFDAQDFVKHTAMGIILN